MGISRMIGSTIQYISEAVTRIFGPNQDAYPNIGVQPFTGDALKQEADRERG